MLDELRTAALYRGYRGGPAADASQLAEIITVVGDLLSARDEIAVIEMNPLRVTTRGLLALDALVIPRSCHDRATHREG
jgi:hypothetical protein